ncbi:MAG TPA: flagellar motor switch protein FliN [Candidatus Aerophobetes bacterium]|uniref:Flagellar motor switch protein FliN n=1 Tax=Aerophobetes bacterium TaxID=2030807 RepID=A0A7V5LZT9_UNCAE|nr:flagellar motor switch protein FliN [Candidatus Aerophobetes bacterium]
MENVGEKKEEEKIEVKPAEFPKLDKEKDFSMQSQSQQTNLEAIFDVPLQISAELGRTSMSIKEILQLAPGSVIELDKLAGEPVDLLVNGKLIAKGEVVVTEENFAVRITEIIGQEARIRKLQ